MNRLGFGPNFCKKKKKDEILYNQLKHVIEMWKYQETEKIMHLILTF